MIWTLSSFLLLTAFVALIAYWKTRKDRMVDGDAYFLGGRSLGGWVIAGSLMLTNLSTEHLIGLNGDAFKHTVAVMAWETTSALAMVLLALYFLPRYLKRGFTTIPEFLAERFDVQTQVVATILFLFSYAFAILPVVLRFGASGLDALFDVSKLLGLSTSQTTWLLVWGVGSLGSLYAIFGGLKAVAISDTINGVGFLIAGLLVTALGLAAVGEGSMAGGLVTLFEQERPKFDITGDEPGSFLPFGALFTGMVVNQVFFWCTNQSIVQRALGAKNLAEGQKGVLIAAGFKLLGPLVVVLPGIIAFHLFKGRLGPDDYMMAYPTLVKTVLPAPLMGMFAAVMVGAILSTFNSVLNSAATLFSEGIYRRYINCEPSGRELVRSGRVCSVVLALFAMFVAPLLDTSGSLYNTLQKINATFFGPMLAVILLGFTTNWVTARAAKVSLIVGPILFYLIAFAFGDEVQRVLRGVLGFSEDLHFLHLLAFVFCITALLAIALSRVFASDFSLPASSRAPVSLTPWRYARPVAIFVSVATVLCYAVLAQ